MIGMGKEDVDWIKKVLAARDRTCGGFTAPAAGLYLLDVEYPESFGLPRVRVPANFPCCVETV